MARGLADLRQVLPHDTVTLTRLLERRPDVLGPPPPLDLDELADRLDDPYSVVSALQSASLPVIQCAQAAVGLGGRTSLAQVSALLGSDPAIVVPFLTWLHERFLLRLDGSEVLAPPGLVSAVGDPLGLGPALADLLEEQTVDGMRRMLLLLGQPRPVRKADVVAALGALLRDPDWVRATISSAPEQVRGWLLEVAADNSDDTDQHPTYDLAAHRAARAGLVWAGERGLVAVSSWGSGYAMSREVTLALRGADHQAPFDPVAPAPERFAVDPVVLGRSVASAATSFAADAAAVLDRVRRQPPSLLKSGGVGAREMTKLAKATGVADSTVRLVLELAGRLQLFTFAATTLQGSDRLGQWRDAEPAERYADLVDAWWTHGDIPTEDRVDDKTKPALRGQPDCTGCRNGRYALVAAVGAADGSVFREAAGALAVWNRPLLHPDFVGGAPFGGSWAEASTMGVLGAGGLDGVGMALSPIGAALLDGDRGALLTAAGALLPAATVEVLLGADLTAVAPGAPSTLVTSLLDGCAERESGGGAVTWRFSPGSVRRALDGGTSAVELAEKIRGIARNGVPQPLEYLINDVGRRHGAMRVRTVTSVVRSDDVALLAQAAADRSLQRLGLVLLAPTVLASSAPQQMALDALRAAGYLPVPDEPVATPAVPDVDVGVRRWVREHGFAHLVDGSAQAVDVQPVSAGALAEALLHGGTPAPAPGDTERWVRECVPSMLPSHARLLADAVDHGTAVHITYLSVAGRTTERVISELQLFGAEVTAFCHLRQDERNFSLRGITTVRPAPAGG